MLRQLLAPPLCWSCRAPAAAASALCRACRRALRFLAAEPVRLCGVAVWAPVAYSGPARELVAALKFRGALRVADEMAGLMLANAPPELALGGGAPVATLVPVPLHPRRARERAFNQASVLARALAARWARGAGVALPVEDCLGRGGDAGRQLGRGRAARLEAPRGSIGLRRRPPPRVLLVDDVVTTGATLGACAAALLGGGCSQVAAIAFARTLGR